MVNDLEAHVRAMQGSCRPWMDLLAGALTMFLCVSVAAQEGYYGAGHDKWHQNFYSNLKRNDGQGSCCNLMDCRPTQSRMIGDHYEVKVDGEWVPVPNDKIKSDPQFSPRQLERIAEEAVRAVLSQTGA